MALSHPVHQGLRLIFGSMTIAGQVDEDDAVDLLNKFFAFYADDKYAEIDTAFMYCETRTEQTLGHVLTAEQRARLRIATKANPGHKGGFSPESITTQLTTSLKNLKMQSTDIFYLHWPDHKLPLEPTLKTVDELHKKGLFRELGISNYRVDQVEEIFAICEQNGYIKPTVYQGMYNLLTRSIEELVPVLRKNGARLYVYNPLAGGLLTGKYKSVQDKPAPKTRFDSAGGLGKRYTDRYWKQSYFDAINHLDKAVQEHLPGKTLAEVSLTWLHHHSQLQRDSYDGIIVGQSSATHLHTNLYSGTQGSSPELLPSPVLKAIDEAWDIVKADCPPYYR